MSTFVLVGDLVEILDENNERLHCGTVIDAQICFDRASLLDRRFIVVSGWYQKIPDSDVRVLLSCG